MADELILRDAFRELRDMFPKGTNQIDVGASDGVVGHEHHYVSQADIIISNTRWGAKRFRADTLADAMAQVRAWRKEQR